MTFKAKALSLVRRGKREVILTAIGFNGGNNLFKWQLAYSRTLDKGLISKVLYFPNQDAWLEMFPGLRKLSITSDQIRLTAAPPIWGQLRGWITLRKSAPALLKMCC